MTSFKLSVLALLALLPVQALATDEMGTPSGILPGFEPVAVSGTRVTLSVGRAYTWSSSYLPVRVESRGTQLAGPQMLELGGNALAPSAVSVTDSSPDHVVIQATGTALGGTLSILATTRVEYDGAAFVVLSLTPKGSISIPSLLYTVDVQHPNDFLTMLRYDTTEKAPDHQSWIRIQGRGRTVKPLAWDGAFQNVVQFQDGQKAFTWFADDAKGWIWNGGNVTKVVDNGVGSTVTLTQRIIGSAYTLSNPLKISFQFMASPVKTLKNGWRTSLRPQYGLSPTNESQNYGHVVLWWPTGLCNIDLPYAECPPKVLAMMPPEDRKQYVGLAYNKTLLAKARSFSTDLLPYFSSLITSLFDPVIAENHALWEVGPPNRFRQAFPPYGSQEYATFSLRRNDWLDYRLKLIDRVITEYGSPGIEGLYLDQTQLWDSESDNGDAWTDSNGVKQRSTNIVALRTWLMRLRSLFVNHNRKALIYAHDSATEIVPVLSFMTVSVDGEQFTSPERNPRNDYAVDVSPDLWRTEFTTSQFGVPVHVLSECTNSNCAPEGLTREQARGFYAQLLLHDSWTVSNAMNVKRDVWPVQDILDAFGYDADDSIFLGYWTKPAGALCTPPCYVSYYKRPTANTALLIVSNLSALPSPVSVKVNDEELVGGVATFTPRYPEKGAVKEIDQHLSISIPARDFQILEVHRAQSLEKTH
jgi:hypothetical protein